MNGTINLKALSDQVSVVSELQSRLNKVREDHKRVRALCGTGYEITIAGVRITVAKMDDRTYQAKMVRGCEMIHLGAVKALDAAIDKVAESLRVEELKLASLASGGAS